jgi:hypothetical protein
MCQNLDRRFLFYCLLILVFFLPFSSPFVLFCVLVFYCLLIFLFVVFIVLPPPSFHVFLSLFFCSYEFHLQLTPTCLELKGLVVVVCLFDTYYYFQHSALRF